MSKASWLIGCLLLAASAMADGPFEFQFEEIAPGVWTGIREDAPRFPVMGNTPFVVSDYAKVFVNGRLVYTGSNLYRSRDYRYLGTIGLFDSVLLPLERGDNEICIAASEAFGGWGIMARIEPD